MSTLRPWSDIERFIINWEFLQEETAAIYEEHGTRLCKVELLESSEAKTLILQNLEFPTTISVKRENIWKEQLFSCYRNKTQLFSRINIDYPSNPKNWLYLNADDDLIFKINYDINSIIEKNIQDQKGANIAQVRYIKSKDNIRNWDKDKTFMLVIRVPEIERLHMLTFASFLLAILME